MIASPSGSVADAFAVLPLNVPILSTIVPKIVSAELTKTGGTFTSNALANLAERLEPFVTTIA